MSCNFLGVESKKILEEREGIAHVLVDEDLVPIIVSGYVVMVER